MHLVRTSIALAIAAPIAATAATATAQPLNTAVAVAPAPELETTAAVEKNDSINISPLGIFFGNLYVTYEHLFGGYHGVIVDAGFGRSSGDDGSEAHGALGVGYRFHWRGRQNSGFVGVSLHQQLGTGNVTFNPGTADEESYDMSVRSTTVTANVGKRWMIGDAWNVTFRIGAGWGSHTAKAEEDTPAAKEAEETMNAILSFLPIGFEGELSAGYNF